MKRLFRYLKNILAGQLLRRRMAYFSRRLNRLDKDRKRNARDLTRRKRELNGLRDDLLSFKQDLDGVENRLRETIDEAVRLQKQYEEQLEASQSQLRIMEDVTVPTLMQQNRVLLKFWEAETAIQVMRTVGASKDSQTDME